MNLSLAAFHESLMGIVPDPDQAAFYAAEPIRFGYRESSFDRKRLLAVIMLALWQVSEGRRVTLIIPPTHEAWAIETLRVVARHVLGRLNGQPLYAVAVAGLRGLSIGSRILGIPEPEFWVTYGFGQDAPVPQWLEAKVLP